ncbi:DNA end protector [Sinorhizobium phage phiM9]|uniref:Putative DNA end protector protein n=1 Tax=Sinorhizobium phage phiM9 TaxID=1636182 RepID=A0A0F6R7D8_9CAUD|nr:DNA end protector [Sinorhizobium phage phiM9]AKE44678.1 putative DNA end protector protein [Sinorhizobium phage phiM9]
MASKDSPDLDFEQVIKDLAKGMGATEANRRQREAIKYFAQKNKSKFVDTDRPGIELMTKGMRGVSDIIPGTIMTYMYDAKNAETLEFWDRAPLIIFLDVQKNGNWLGLNLHYLPPPARGKILGLLMKTVTAKKLRHDVRMRITYQMCQQIAAYQPLQFCLKSYIPKRITTKIVRVQPQDWVHAVFFPSDRFQKKSNRYVWAQSKRFR